MSKLADAIRQTTRTEAPHIGFTPAVTKHHPTILLVGLVQDVAGGTKATAAGADIALLRGVKAGTPDATGKQGEGLRGLWLQDGPNNAESAGGAGFDFIVFDAESAPAALLLDEKTGLVMQAQEELSDGLLQSLQWLPLDALLVHWQGSADALTVRRQLELQRLSGFSRKPLLLFVDGEPQPLDLEAMREAGVVAVVVELSAKGGEARLKALRTRIDGLRPRPKRSRAESPMVSIAGPSAVPAQPEPPEPDEDDE